MGRDGRAKLALVIDYHTREMVGWQLLWRAQIRLLLLLAWVVMRLRRQSQVTVLRDGPTDLFDVCAKTPLKLACMGHENV